MPRILVADDAPALRVLLQRCLEMGGHEAVVATDGTEAINLLRTPGARFDAVVTDHAMPGASGLDVIAAAHVIDPHLPCIIVTAHDDLDLATTALGAGADAFVPKPFKPEHLLTIVDRALEHRRREAAATVPVQSAAQRAGDREWAASLASRAATRLGVDADGAGWAGHVVALRAALGSMLPASGAAELASRPGAAERIRRNLSAAAAALLDGVDEAAGLRQGVLHAGERWDGAGHPDGMVGADIPLLSRIAAAVEVAAAAAGAGAMPVDALRDQAGATLDPAVVDAVCALLTEDATMGEVTGRRTAGLQAPTV